MANKRKVLDVPTSGSHGHEVETIAWKQMPYTESPSAAEIRQFMIDNGMMAAESESSSS